MDTRLKSILKSPKSNVQSSNRNDRQNAVNSSNLKRKRKSSINRRVSSNETSIDKKRRKKSVMDLDFESLSTPISLPMNEIDLIDSQIDKQIETQIQTQTQTQTLEPAIDSVLSSVIDDPMPNKINKVISNIAVRPTQRMVLSNSLMSSDNNSFITNNLSSSMIVTPEVSSSARLTLDDPYITDLRHEAIESNDKQVVKESKYSRYLNKIVILLSIALTILVVARYFSVKNNNIVTISSTHYPTLSLTQIKSDLESLMNNRVASVHILDQDVTHLIDIIEIENNHSESLTQSEKTLDATLDRINTVSNEVQQLVDELNSVSVLLTADQQDSIVEVTTAGESLISELIKVEELITELESQVSQLVDECDDRETKLFVDEIADEIINRDIDIDTQSQELDHHSVSEIKGNLNSIEDHVLQFEDELRSNVHVSDSLQSQSQEYPEISSLLLQQSREIARTLRLQSPLIESVVDELLENYSLLSQGARVLTTDMIPVSTAWIVFQQGRVTKSPNVLLTDSSSENMYCFRGSTGSVTIDLGRPVSIRQIKLPTLKLKRYVDTEPLLVQVSGWSDDNDNNRFDLGLHTISNAQIDTDESNTINVKASSFSRQLRYVEVKVVTNRGGPRTCLFRVIVMGVTSDVNSNH